MPFPVIRWVILTKVRFERTSLSYVPDLFAAVRHIRFSLYFWSSTHKVHLSRHVSNALRELVIFLT